MEVVVDNPVDTMRAWRADNGVLARGLPADAYVNQIFWEAECNTVLRDNWFCAGFAHEIASVGDVMPASVAGQPLLLVRGGDGEVGVFHNVCRHRCLQLVDKPRNVGKMICCPYHSWAYGLDGKLRASPHFGGDGCHRPDGMDPDQYGLVPVRKAVWHDWIFVNLGGEAPPFEDYAAPLIRRLEDTDLDRLHPVAVLDFGAIAANWKMIMENFIEPYHVQFVHRTTTSQPLRKHYTIVDGVCLGSAIDLDEEKGTDGSLAVSSRYLTLFPNFILGRYFPDQIGVYLNVPVGPGEMRQKRAIYTISEKDLSAEEVENLRTLWWNVHKEDHAICERMQLGRQSPVAAGGGVLSPKWEDSVRAFQELVADAVIGAASGRTGRV